MAEKLKVLYQRFVSDEKFRKEQLERIPPDQAELLEHLGADGHQLEDLPPKRRQQVFLALSRKSPDRTSFSSHGSGKPDGSISFIDGRLIFRTRRS